MARLHDGRPDGGTCGSNELSALSLAPASASAPERASASQRASALRPYLKETPEGLVLTDGTLEMRGDFAHLLGRLKPANLAHELVVRAAKVKKPGSTRPFAVDATAGLGEDAFLLAAAGFEVLMFERNATICALTQDALLRARQDERLAAYTCRVQLVETDSIEELSALPRTPDVVLLDPMFPARTKSAAVKKKFQLLHQLEFPCVDEAVLLDAARRANPRKIVVKRPAKGPHLAGVKPDYSLVGKAVRYDVIACASR